MTRTLRHLLARQLLACCLPPLVLVALIALWWLFGSPLDWQLMRETTRRLAPATLLTLCGLHLAQQAGRTARLSILLPSPVPWSRLAAVVLLHQFLSAMLPLKTGSLSMPELLKREGIERSRTLATMVAGMGLDLTGLTLLLLLAALGLQAVPGDVATLQQPMLVICVCLVCAAVLGLVGARRIERWMEANQQWLQVGWRDVLANRVRAFLRTLADLTWRQAAGGVLLGLLNLALGIGFSFLFCRQLAPEVDSRSILLVILVMQVIGKFAIQGLAGLGTSEAVLVLLFCGIGLSPSEAVTVTVLGRVFHLGLITAGAGLGALLLSLPRRRGQPAWQS